MPLLDRQAKTGSKGLSRGNKFTCWKCKEIRPNVESLKKQKDERTANSSTWEYWAINTTTENRNIEYKNQEELHQPWKDVKKLDRYELNHRIKSFHKRTHLWTWQQHPIKAEISQISQLKIT